MSKKSVAEFIKEKGFSFVPTFSGGLLRFSRGPKGSESAWAVGKTYQTGSKTVQRLWFGDFATGESHEWWSDLPATPEEQKAMAAAVEHEQKIYQAEKKERQRFAAGRAQATWDKLQDPLSPGLGQGLTEYQVKKKLNFMHGARRTGDTLFVPLRDIKGELWNLQRIEPDGTKRFMSGGRITGLFHTIGELSPEGEIYVCEGYATGATIYEALCAARRVPNGKDLGGPGGNGSAAREGQGDHREVCREEQGSPGQIACQKPAYAQTDHREGQGGLGRESGQGIQPPSPGLPIPQSHRVESLRGRMGQLDSGEPTGLEEVLARRKNGRVDGDFRHGDVKPTGSGAVGKGLGQDARAGHGQGNHSPDQALCTKQPEGQAGPPARRYTGPSASNRGGSEGQAGSAGSGDTARGLGQEAPGADHRDDGCPRWAVVVAFNAGNLIHVCKSLKKKYPRARFVVCADNDRKNCTGAKDSAADSRNTGIRKGRAAAQSIGAEISYPDFDHLPDCADVRLSDFNDLACVKGLEFVGAYLCRRERARIAWPGPEVTAAIDERIARLGLADSPGPVIEGVENLRDNELLVVGPMDRGQPDEELPPVPTRAGLWESGQPVSFEPVTGVNKKGEPVLPYPQAVADELLRAYEGTMLKQDDDLFRYQKTHWVALGLAEIHELKAQAQELCGGLASAAFLEGVLELVKIGTPSVPKGRDMFTPSPLAVNFLNGTLHVDYRGGEYSTRFAPHHRADLLVNVLPYEYQEELPVNAEFEEMMERIFEGDHDKAEKIQAMREMFGACLVPLFPHLFMLYGPPGTGKSTVMKLAARLVHESNLCSVEPHEFHGFHMSSMAGKLVNLDTDITTNKPIHDSVVKKIEDRRPFKIQRKYERDLYAPLPAIHIFGGNDIPPTLEASRAHDRRWSFVEFNHVMTNGGYVRDYAERCFDVCPQGVLRFALEGLHSLLRTGGKFTNCASGLAKMEEWQMRNDLVGQFLADVEAGEATDGNTRLYVRQDARIERKKLWEIYSEWQYETSPQMRPIGKHAFFQRMEERKFKTVVVKGTYLLNGIGVVTGPGAAF